MDSCIINSNNQIVTSKAFENSHFCSITKRGILFSTYSIDIEPSWNEYEDYRLKTYIDEYILMSFDGAFIGTGEDSRFIKTIGATEGVVGIYDVHTNIEIIPPLFKECTIVWVSSEPYFIVEDCVGQKGLYNANGKILEASEIDIQFIKLKPQRTPDDLPAKDEMTNYIICTDKDCNKKILYKDKIICECIQGFSMLQTPLSTMAKNNSKFIIINKNGKQYLYHCDKLVSEIESDIVFLLHYDAKNCWFNVCNEDKSMQGLLNEDNIHIPMTQQKLVCKFKGREDYPLIGIKYKKLYEGDLDHLFFDNKLRFITFSTDLFSSKTIIAFADEEGNVIFYNEKKEKIEAKIINLAQGKCVFFKNTFKVFSYSTMDFMYTSQEEEQYAFTKYGFNTDYVQNGDNYDEWCKGKVLDV